jgi:ADP-heptose:LPS heptosyltransferase
MRKEKIDKILVMNLGGIGDLLLSVPFLRGLRQSYPDSFITLWVVNRAKEIVQGLNYFDELLVFDLQELRFSDFIFRPGRLWNALIFLLSQRKKKYSLAINLLPLVNILSALKVAIVFLLIGSNKKAGRDTNGRGFIYGIKIYEKDMPELYDVNLQASLLEEIGGKKTKKELEIYLGEEEESNAGRILKGCGFSDVRLLVGVNPGADWPSKRWGAGNFAEVINGLSEGMPINVVITGGGNDEGIAKELAELLKVESCVLAGKTTLKTLAAILKRVDLFITNDTGPMHIAIAVKTPVVAVVGPGYFKRFIPESPDIITVRKDVDCSPCTRRECDSMKCLREVYPFEVLHAAERLLKRR